MYNVGMLQKAIDLIQVELEESKEDSLNALRSDPDSQDTASRVSYNSAFASGLEEAARILEELIVELHDSMEYRGP